MDQRFRCCVCGHGTSDALDHVRLEITSEEVGARQWLSARAGCINGVLAPGFSIEIHLM